MELIKVINARKALNGLSEYENINPHLAYWMTKFIVKTEDEYKFYICEMDKIFNKYAKKAEADSFIVPPENVAAFNCDVERLNKTDVGTPGITFNLSELASEVKMSMQQMYPLLDFINEDE